MDLATLVLKVDASGAVRQVEGLNRVLAENVTQATKTEKAMGVLNSAAKATAVAGVAALALGIRKVVEESKQAQAVQAQLAAGLQSTKGASGQTLASLNAMAEALQKVSTFGDEAIGSGQALLLTFTKIGGDVFPRATQAIVDMATRMGGDLTGAAIQLGKALNDPVAGLTSLSRSGVQFSEQQKAVIEDFVRTNQLARAQGVILNEIETQFGGSAKAARDTLGGALTALSNAWGDLFEVSRERSAGIVKAIDSITAALPRMRDAGANLVLEWDIIATKLAITFEEMARKANLLDAGSGALLYGVSQGKLGGDFMARQLAQSAQNKANLAALRALLEEQEKALAAQVGAQRATQDGTSVLIKHTDAVVAAASAYDLLAKRNAAWETNVLNRNRGVAKSVPGRPSTGDPMAPIGLPGSGLSPHTFWRGMNGGDGLVPDAAVNAFRENLSRAVGDAIARGLMDGLRSPEAFIRSLRDVASSAIGQAISDKVSGKIGDALSGLGMAGLGAAAAGIGVFGAVADALFGASDKQREAAEAMQRAAEAVERGTQKQFGQDVAAWKASATATPGQQALFGLQGTAAGFAEEWFAKTLGGATGWRRDFLNSQRSMYGDIDFSEIEKILRGMQGESGLGASSRVYTNAQMAEFQAIMDAYQANVTAMTRAQDIATADTVGQYRGTLSLSGFSPLSPMEQAKEARRQYDTLVASALGGDRGAAEKLTGASNAFLQASRSVNASGGRYVADFNTVNQQLKMVEDLFRGRATAEEEATLITGRIANATERSNEIAGAGFTAVTDSLALLIERVAELETATREYLA